MSLKAVEVHSGPSLSRGTLATGRGRWSGIGHSQGLTSVRVVGDCDAVS